MAEYFEIRLHGVEHLQTLHLHVTADNQPVLDRLTALENLMSDLNDAVNENTAAQAAKFAEIQADVDHLIDLAQQALDNDATDAATIADLRQQIADAAAKIRTNTSSLQAFDADPSFPAAPPVEPPAG